MNAKKAKRIRKRVYGDTSLAKNRQHGRAKDKSNRLVSDPQRRIYKKMKKKMKGT